MAGITDFVPNVNGAQILSWIMVACIVIISVSAIALILWYVLKRKKYNQYRVEIFDRDVNGNVYREYDRAGVFLDKKQNMRLLYLEKFKKGLNPNNIPYTSTRDSKGRVIKTVYLRRVGVNNYVFLKMNVDEQTVKVTVGEEDLNGAAHEMNKIRNSFNKESWLKKMAPIIAGLIVMVIVMVVLIVLFNKFEILATVSNNLLEVTEKQAMITEQLYNITTSNGFNPNAPIIVPGGR